MKTKALLVLSNLIFWLLMTTSSVQAAGPNQVVTMLGVGSLMADPPITGALCYEADIVDTMNGRIIGAGIDCLENILEVGDGLSADRTTFFDFPEGNLVANGVTSIAPVTGGSPGFTHIVSDIPTPDSNNISYGTKRYAGASGRVRLSGAVDLTGFPSAVGFNNIFVIGLD